MKSLLRLILFLSLTSVSNIFSQETIHDEMIGRIKEEGFQNSKIQKTLEYLTDVFGPRLLASPQYLKAADWTKNKLEEWNIDSVWFEQLNNKFRGWEPESFSIELLEPTYSPILGWPYAWTAGTNGEIVAVPELFNNILDIDSLENYKGKLRDKVILLDKHYSTDVSFEPYAKRLTDEDLSELKTKTEPIELDKETKLPKTRTLKERMKDWPDNEKEKITIAEFLIKEGIKAIIEPSRKDFGVINVGGNYLTGINDVKSVPHFVIAKEQFYRMVRLINMGIKPRIKFHLKSKFYNQQKYNINVLAEIKGVDKSLSDEIVLAGGHFDSWHSSTGVTDNAASCVVLMEALRILKKLEVAPRRTIRIGLWTGEEQGYFGSMDYVKKHIADIETGELKEDFNNISCYLNLDNGAGKIRGVYLQGSEVARPIFEDLLKPFNYMGAATLTAKGTFYTDHEVFDAAGIPAFQFIQDRLNYSSITHHSNMDRIENTLENDLKHNAVIVASLLYHLAMRDEKLPR